MESNSVNVTAENIINNKFEDNGEENNDKLESKYQVSVMRSRTRIKLTNLQDSGCHK